MKWLATCRKAARYRRKHRLALKRGSVPEDISWAVPDSYYDCKRAWRSGRKGKKLSRKYERLTYTAPCQEPGCQEEGLPCFLPYYSWPVNWPYAFYCVQHIYQQGFCRSCGLFWGGNESFDYRNPSELCPNCQSDWEDRDFDDEEDDCPYPDDYYFPECQEPLTV